ncbi:hypothetical protein Amet_0846 [Alkaliphilus metalliredigens QYMF]|uniref:Nuclease SbcCD subunit C n=1 Tax=Alkaliphilus metalliredigens (strain QYMF) TaxID=293826 RepID=A6TLK3_ALKMQ|nr:AAA family ATPase [Alkaliphilus metalliredigens]ABR47071.1 hypothetical protein Amet_0846 [Alkaliphilus metalliredigens QYMF]
MGRLAIRKVIYSGDNYYFESPHLDDGLVILEGPNGHGKSTFMDLIYYGLGGKVIGFDKSDKNAKKKHTEIFNDQNNYIELLIEIDGKEFELTRYIGNNQITVVDFNETVIQTSISRLHQIEQPVFSDWILDKLGISVFDIVQGTNEFKLNLSDLMRLIYHDQSTDIDKVYKDPDNSNFITDSLEIRKAIFEVLIGKNYNDYYESLGKYKIKFKEYEEAKAVLDSYNHFLDEIKNDDLENVIHIEERIKENNDRIKKIEAERELAYASKNSVSKTFEIIDDQKKLLFSYEDEKAYLVRNKFDINKFVDKIMYLINESQKELEEIQKIRFVDKKLKLFNPDTCPYCLHEVKRQENKCICGSEIEESEYEKFFYTDSEYLEIMQIKQKSIKSLIDLLEKKKNRMDFLESQILIMSNKITEVREYINLLNRDVQFNYNIAFIKELNKKENEIESDIIELKQAKELSFKKENLASKCNTLRVQVDSLKNQTDRLLALANEDIITKLNSFSEQYLALMKQADDKCYNAYLGQDYMPVINHSEYRERSSQVSKRLMYFVTLLLESLSSDTNFPQLLLIDTPRKEGIDLENLIKCISLFSTADDVDKKKNKGYQIILTTGIDAYPEDDKKKVFLTLVKEKKYLLSEKQIEIEDNDNMNT